MSKFDKLYSKAHVRNHPWFRDREDHIAGMRQAMQRKSEAEFSLHDVFNEKKQIGLQSGDRTLNAYIQEAAITAREALNPFDFPIRPQISYNNSRQVKFASHDPTQVVEAEILFNVRMSTVSGVMKTATMPLKVISGMVVPPSVLIFDGRIKTLGQATVDELVLRHTSYALQPSRTMFSPPMTYAELETAVSTRNEVGYQPREMSMEGKGVRRTNRRYSPLFKASQVESDPSGDIDAGVSNMMDWAGDQVAGWGDKQRNRFNESSFGKLWNYGEHGPYDPNKYQRNRDVSKYNKTLDRNPMRESPVENSSVDEQDEFVDYGEVLPPIPEDDGMSWMEDEDEATGAPARSVARKRSEMDPEVARWYKMYQASGSSPEDAIELAKEQAGKMNTKTSRKMRNQRALSAKSAQSSAVDPWSDTGVWDFNGQSPINTLQDNFTGPGAGESQEIDISSDDTTFLYGQILANKDIMRWMADAMNPSIDQVVDNVFETVSPFVESLHLDANRIDWYSLAEDLLNLLGGDRPRGARITQLTARRIAFITTEYLTLRRRFGYRRAASSADAEVAQWRSTLDSSVNNMSPEDRAFVNQLLDKAQEAADQGDAATTHDLAEQVRYYFDSNGLNLTDADASEEGVFQQSGFQDPGTFLQDAPADPNQDPDTFFQQGEDVPTKLWGSLMALMERKGRAVKVAGGTPLGYLEVVEAMLDAEEAGLDTFPRPFLHVARNYIMARTNTASQNQWMPHLINDGFVINPLGINRGRTRRASSHRKAGLAPALKHQVDQLYQKYIRATDEVDVENIVSQIFEMGDDAADYFNNRMEMNLPGEMEADTELDEVRYASKRALKPRNTVKRARPRNPQGV